jgi:hypothetical protein
MKCGGTKGGKNNEDAILQRRLFERADLWVNWNIGCAIFNTDSIVVVSIMKKRPSFPDLPGIVDGRRTLVRFSNKAKERLRKEELKPGMLVKMFNLRVKGIAVVLDYPFENTVEVLDPNGDIQFTNANYLMPLEK